MNQIFLKLKKGKCAGFLIISAMDQNGKFDMEQLFLYGHMLIF